ncbi:glycosyltransferase family 4 protein [Blastococcus sp. SYSU D00695]
MTSGSILVVHPSADLYGSDLQLLESVRGLVDAGWHVVVSVPGPGPLVARLEATGAVVGLLPVPVVRKSLLSPLGLGRLAVSCARALPRMWRQLRAGRHRVVYVNTVTVPLWLVAARLARVPALCHVHEAEEVGRALSLLLNAPLLLARTVVVNSRAAEETVVRAVPVLRSRTRVVHNGMAGPPEPPGPPPAAGDGTHHVVLVARLSPRKGTDVALEAVARLRDAGRDVRLELCGSVFRGYEWFQQELEARAQRPDLAGAVHFAGYTSPTWDALARAEVVLVPSRAEPFGNTAVEAQLAGRPVIASDVQGLREIVDPGRTGLLVPPEDPGALAGALARLLDDPAGSAELARAGRESALRRFTSERYRAAVVGAVADTAGRRSGGAGATPS